MDPLDVDDSVYLSESLWRSSLLTAAHGGEKKKTCSRPVTLSVAVLCLLLLVVTVSVTVLYQQVRSAHRHNSSDAPGPGSTREDEELQEQVKSLAEDHMDLRRQKLQLLWSLQRLREELVSMESNFSSLRREQDLLLSHQQSLDHEPEQLVTHNWNLLAQLNRSESSLHQLLSDHRAQVEGLELRLERMGRRNVELQKQLDLMAVRVRGRRCQAGWSHFNLSCYYVSTSRRNWTESRRDCVDRGGDLVVIDSQEEQMFLSSLLHVAQNAWMGLTDLETEGVWTWVDHSPLTTQFWQPGQPNDWNSEQDCGELTRSSSEGPGQWNDDACDAQQHWLCER